MNPSNPDFCVGMSVTVTCLIVFAWEISVRWPSKWVSEDFKFRRSVLCERSGTGRVNTIRRHLDPTSLAVKWIFVSHGVCVCQPNSGQNFGQNCIRKLSFSLVSLIRINVQIKLLCLKEPITWNARTGKNRCVIFLFGWKWTQGRSYSILSRVLRLTVAKSQFFTVICQIGMVLLNFCELSVFETTSLSKILTPVSLY